MGGGGVPMNQIEVEDEPELLWSRNNRNITLIQFVENKKKTIIRHI